MVTVISLGGSIVAPDAVDTDFIKNLLLVLREHLESDSENRLVIIVGGGAPARNYQAAFREISTAADNDAQDWIGIMATRLNAELIKGVFGPDCLNDVVTDPTADFSFDGRVLIAAGWKPGFSTDFDAVKLAERFSAERILNLSNIEQVFSADPKLDPEAKPLETISWQEYSAMVGDTWIPGKNTPFDPVATKRAAELKLKVITAGGKNLENLRKILAGQPFLGTVIG